MAHLRLLERINAMNGEQGLLSFYETESILASVHGHIAKLLNTRQGSCLIADDFGIPDFTNYGATFSRDDIPYFEKEIAGFLMKYEPRFQGVSVRFVPDEKSKEILQFAIEGHILTEGGVPMQVRWFTAVNPLGKFELHK
jgi:type VI secretion system lysozyme-related protein